MFLEHSLDVTDRHSSSFCEVEAVKHIGDGHLTDFVTVGRLDGLFELFETQGVISGAYVHLIAEPFVHASLSLVQCLSHCQQVIVVLRQHLNVFVLLGANRIAEVLVIEMGRGSLQWKSLNNLRRLLLAHMKLLFDLLDDFPMQVCAPGIARVWMDVSEDVFHLRPVPVQVVADSIDRFLDVYWYVL